MKTTLKFNDNHELRALKTLAQVEYDRNSTTKPVQLMAFVLQDLVSRIQTLEMKRYLEQRTGKGSLRVTMAEIAAIQINFQIHNFQPFEKGIYHKLIFPLLHITI